MTKEKWLYKAREHQDDLRSLVGNYHPSAGKPRHQMRITAPAAEAACERIRASIATREKEDPVVRFDRALMTGDIHEVNTVLNEAWFGVPESTSCWNIRGFSVAVDLMDDPPEELESYPAIEE